MRPTDRLAHQAGWQNYSTYLASRHWRNTRSRYYRRYGRRCRGWPRWRVWCPRRARDLHHLRYRDRRGIILGREDIHRDLRGLCRRCHKRAGRQRVFPGGRLVLLVLLGYVLWTVLESVPGQ